MEKKLRILIVLACIFVIYISSAVVFQIVSTSAETTTSFSVPSHATIEYPQPSPTILPTSTGLHVDGTHLKDANGNIVILRGVVYSTSQWWGDATSQCTEQQFVYMHDMGCNCVSLSIQDYTFDQYHGSNCYNDPSFWTKLDNIMAWAYAHDLYVNLRFWATSGYDANGNPSNHLNTYMAGGANEYTWSYWLGIADIISNRYKSYTNIIYEPLSESLYISASDYQSHMQDVIDTIRANVPNAIVNVQAESSGDWPCTFDFEKSNPINRSNIIFSADPYGFFTYPDNSQSAIISSLNSLGVNWLHANGRCVVFSEFGGDCSAYNSWSSTWVQNFMTMCDANGISGYTAFRWCTAASDVFNLLTAWNGNLSTFGNDLRAYYLAH
jgi:hypothetical protein